MIEPLIRAQGAGSRARFAGVPKDRLSGLKRGLVDGAESTCSLGDLEALSAVVLGRSMGIVACRRAILAAAFDCLDQKRSVRWFASTE